MSVVKLCSESSDSPSSICRACPTSLLKNDSPSVTPAMRTIFPGGSARASSRVVLVRQRTDHMRRGNHHDRVGACQQWPKVCTDHQQGPCGEAGGTYTRTNAGSSAERDRVNRHWLTRACCLRYVSTSCSRRVYIARTRNNLPSNSPGPSGQCQDQLCSPMATVAPSLSNPLLLLVNSNILWNTSPHTPLRPS
jgi:hypothetical protein